MKIDALAMLMANKRNIIYIQDIEEDAKEWEYSKAYEKGIAELGMGLSLINVNNLQSDIQRLQLS